MTILHRNAAEGKKGIGTSRIIITRAEKEQVIISKAPVAAMPENGVDLPSYRTHCGIDDNTERLSALKQKTRPWVVARLRSSPSQ
jgi:hypothetical protein